MNWIFQALGIRITSYLYINLAKAVIAFASFQWECMRTVFKSCKLHSWPWDLLLINHTAASLWNVSPRNGSVSQWNAARQNLEIYFMSHWALHTPTNGHSNAALKCLYEGMKHSCVWKEEKYLLCFIRRFREGFKFKLRHWKVLQGYQSAILHDDRLLIHLSTYKM